MGFRVSGFGFGEGLGLRALRLSGFGVDKEHDYPYLSDLFLQWFSCPGSTRICRKTMFELSSRKINYKEERAKGEWFHGGALGALGPGFRVGGLRALDF